MKTMLLISLSLMLVLNLYSQAYDSESFTYQNKDGNPYVKGQGILPDSEYLDIELKGKPLWITTINQGQKIITVVLLDDGSIQAFEVTKNSQLEISHQFNFKETSNVLPALIVKDGIVELIRSGGYDSSFNHPVLLSDGTKVYLTTDGGIKIGDVLLNINPLPDGRILVDNKDRILILTDPSSRYTHGVLGDSIEAESFTIIETKPEIRIQKVVKIPSPSVIEGIKPIWFDLNKDGNMEILVTVSDRTNGARLVLFDEEGNSLAESSSIGMGNRWRHQLTIGPIGPNGEIEIVDVLTPHIGGPLEFFRWEGNRINVVSSIRGYTSHVMGSRNLDMSVTGDFNGDGIPEIIVPTFNRKTLGAIQRKVNGSEEVYTLTLGSRLVTNLSAFSLSDGKISLAVGLDNNTLRIWLPDK